MEDSLEEDEEDGEEEEDDTNLENPKKRANSNVNSSN